MAKYRKRPLVVEASQYHASAVTTPHGVCHGRRCGAPGPHVHTHGGPVTIEDGDWVITDASGPYPCKAARFEETYELVELEEGL